MHFPWSRKRPYRGGPHFDRPYSLCFELDGTTLELTLPSSNLVTKEPPRLLNLPFNAQGWFEAHSERRNIHDYVHLHTELWYYFPQGLKRLINLVAMGTNEPMGDFSVCVHLNKLKQGRRIDLRDPRSLGN